MIYVASKVRHAQIWRDLRAQGWRINSTWIDEAAKGQTKDHAELWKRCIQEVSAAAVLVVYRAPGDEMKGGLVEVGAALATSTRVYAVGHWTIDHTWLKHPDIEVISPKISVQQLFLYTLGGYRK